MIARIAGRLTQKRNTSIILENSGISYEVFLPVITISGIEDHINEKGDIQLITYHYHHLEPSRSVPTLIGFLNEIEKDFFEVFITVSGIGPKAALRAINVPISSIVKAIDEADINFLRSLPGIGPQRAKEIVAKLQGKIGKFGLIRDTGGKVQTKPAQKDTIEEAIDVLIQLQYKKNEAKEMINEALRRDSNFKTVEELLNIVYQQKARK